MILARAIAVYGLGRLSNFFTPTDTPMREQTLLWWGGLCGSVAIALALSVPETLAEYPSLNGFANEQLHEELMAIEAETYAELVQTGQLNQELAPLLEYKVTQSNSDFLP
jgi:Sodium/hydrogen exchanger family